MGAVLLRQRRREVASMIRDGIGFKFGPIIVFEPHPHGKLNSKGGRLRCSCAVQKKRVVVQILVFFFDSHFPF